MSADSDARKLCSLEELFLLVTIMSKNSHLYSTDIDASPWFTTTIMKTAQAIFPNDNDDSGWFKRIFPRSTSDRQIVAAYRANKKCIPF